MQPKHLVEMSYPYRRIQSNQCQVYYQSETERKLPVNKAKALHCKHCQALANSVRKAKKRKAAETPTRKLKRRRTTSNYPIKYLTPRSRKIRLSRIQKARFFLRQKVSKLEKQLESREIELNDPVSSELSQIMQIINENHQDALQETLDSTNSSTKEILQQTWNRDSKIQHLQHQKEFIQDQAQSMSSQRKRKWSAITLRIANAVYNRSRSAYKALKSFNILHLPSESTLLAKSRMYNHKPGVNEEYLAEQKTFFENFKGEKLLKGEKPPMGGGILIFDEVKVIEKIAWSSKTHEFLGYAMNEEDFGELTDIFKPISSGSPSPAQYVLQYLWRDLTSGYDVIGPYFTSAYPFQQKSLIATFYQTLNALQLYNFKVMGVVCDGASKNLALIKVTMGVTGAFEATANDEMEYNFKINPSFDNPFSKDSRKIHWIICPSHQLKNMVGQLYASRNDGPKNFKRNGSEFGWQQIADVRSRDIERVKKGQLRVARRLLDSYIERDSWTKLNVAPSKIMQQEDVLCELFGFGHGEDGTEERRKSALETYKYLRACNKLFENGILSSKQVENVDSKCI